MTSIGWRADARSVTGISSGHWKNADNCLRAGGPMLDR
jgi:hypothetical protein